MIDYSLCYTISPAKLQKNSTNKKNLSKKKVLFPFGSAIRFVLYSYQKIRKT